MEREPKISEAEYKVLNVIWEKSPLTGNEVIDALSKVTNWKPNTVRTLIARLVRKKVLLQQKNGKEYKYTPLLTKKECIKEEKKSFMYRFFDGSLLPMIAHFVKDEELTEKEMNELKKMLENKG